MKEGWGCLAGGLSALLERGTKYVMQALVDERCQERGLNELGSL